MRYFGYVTFERLDFAAANCSVAATLAIVGEKWTLLVLREAFYGLRRFDDILQGVGCAKNLLAERLRRLVEHGVLEQVPYREPGQRERHEYRLTERGLELFPILVALMQWGDRWLVGKAGAPVLLEHHDCGAKIRAELRCTAGHGPLSARDSRPRPGPGAKKARKRTPA